MTRSKRRVNQEIDRRMLDVALDWRRPDLWNTRENNWNLVCNSDLVQIALYQVHDSTQLATLIHTLCRRIDYALAYFPPDGGCVEGPGYWEYGVTHFLNLAIALQQRTGGAVNLADDPHIHAICRYPLAAQLRGSKRASFADASDSYLAAHAALKVNHFFKMPELFRLVAQLPGNLLDMGDIRTLSLYDGERPDSTIDTKDYFLPDLCYAKINGGSGELLAVVAGTNDVSHNHNDIGSFIVMFDDLVALTDPGLPHYNSKTFGPNRYDMLVCRSKGHSVPVINGFEQADGPKHFGTLKMTGLNTSGAKTASIDFARAYPDPTLLELRRQIQLGVGAGVRITDSFKFSADPKSIEEAFVTFDPVSIAEGEILIGEGANKVAMISEQKGTFAVELYTHEQHEGQDPRTLHRITFHPATLAREIHLSFVVSRKTK